MWYGAGVCGFVGGERVTSFLLCAPLAVGRRGLAVVRGGARHSFVSESLHVARASFFGDWGCVCERRGGDQGRRRLLLSAFLLFYTPKCAKGRRSTLAPASTAPRSYHTTRRQRPGARARRGEDPPPHPKVPCAVTRQRHTDTHPVCAVNHSGPSTRHDTSTSTERLCYHLCYTPVSKK